MKTMLNAYNSMQAMPEPKDVVAERERVRNKLIDQTGQKPSEEQVDAYTKLILEQNSKRLG
jgi:hypothetical protein